MWRVMTSSRVRASRDEHAARLLLWLLLAMLAILVLWPIAAMLGQALHGGLAVLGQTLAQPGLRRAAVGSLWAATLTTALVVPLAYGYAAALTRVALPGRAAFRLLALLPLLAPSLLPGISLVYLFGNQGLLKHWFAEGGLYGLSGIVLGEAFYTFPHALMILLTTLAVGDARLYEAARTLGAGPLRRFATLTLPASRHGLLSAAMVVFTLGEIIVIPAEYMFIDRIAPPHLRGVYYGTQNLANLGGAFGPILVGCFLALFAPHWVFVMLGAFIIGGGVFYVLGSALSERQARGA